MKKLVLAVVLILLLAGCSSVKSIGSKQEDNLSGSVSEADSANPSEVHTEKTEEKAETPSSTVNQPKADKTEKTETPSETVNQPKADKTEKAETPSDTVKQPEADTTEKSEASSEVAASSSEKEEKEDSKKAEDSGERAEQYDAEKAVKMESVDGGIKVVFEELPQTAEDLEALLALYPQSDARNTGAFFIASLVRYVDSSDDGLAMIDLLRGVRPMNDMDKNFLKDRLRDKTYLPGAYFEGAKPENDYTPDDPWTLMVYDDPMQAEEGYLYIQVATTGADSRRRITLREKDGQYYLWEYSNVLTGIRLPASEDPWL